LLAEGIVYVGSNDRSLYAFNHLAISSAITVVLQEGSWFLVQKSNV